MPAQPFDFVRLGKGSGNPCEQGATFYQQIKWSVENPPGSGTQVPINLTGYIAKMQIRKLHKTDPVIAELSSLNDISGNSLGIVFDPLNGILNLTISAAKTALLIPGTYKYDLDLTDSNGFVTRLIEGSFEVVEQITV
jgi:hypothetical protein